MLTDFKFIFLWWSVFFVLGAVLLPLTLSLFHKFWDKGYIFSKTLSVILLTYIIFILGVFKFAPFTSLTLLGIIIVAVGLNILFFKNNQNLYKFTNLVKNHWKIFLVEEILFFLILTTWSFIRGYASNIEGLEKYMDWGFVNSALRSQFMPPADMWFAGQPINYYYFGHLITAVLTKLSTIDSAITYNLAIASTCALTFTSTFSLASNFVFILIKKISLKKIVLAGFISAMLLTFGGNMHPIYKIIKLNIEQNQGQLNLSLDAVQKASAVYWYPDATRFIGFDPDVKDKTIHEFPLYSFVVADLHGHMNDIPLVLLFLAFLFSVSLTLKNSVLINWKLIVPLGFFLSIAFMTNAWDFAVYGLVFAVFSFIYKLNSSDLKSALTSTFVNGLLVIFFWYIFTLPFSLNFIPMADGLRLSDSHTPFYQLFILYGGFWLICLPFVIFFLASLRAKRGNLVPADFFVFSLVITATLLIILPEIGYIKDIYIYEHRRANTMFKLVYEAFILYSLSSGYIFIRLARFLPLRLLFTLIFVIHLIYPYFAIKSFYSLKDYQGLWGLNYLKNDYPDNFAAIEWINKNISGQPIMLEASGDSYTTYNQVSSATGLPTVIGWIVHEWLWRGGYDLPAARATDVEKIYQSVDANEAKALLQKYSVHYIFVGDKEREKYLKINEKIFTDLGAQIVFQSGQTKVYKLQ